MGLKFDVDDDWGDLPEEAIEGIKAGLEDVKAGRVHSHEYVMAYMEEKLNWLRSKNDHRNKMDGPGYHKDILK